MRRYNDDPIEANASAPQTCHESLITDDLGSIGGFNRFGNGNMTLAPQLDQQPTSLLYYLVSASLQREKPTSIGYSNSNYDGKAAFRRYNPATERLARSSCQMLRTRSLPVSEMVSSCSILVLLIPSASFSCSCFCPALLSHFLLFLS